MGKKRSDASQGMGSMILALISFAVLDALVLIWGLKLRGFWLWLVIIVFLLFLLPLPYLHWLMKGARQPGFWTAFFLVRPVFAWHFNWIAFVFFVAPLILVLRIISGFWGSDLIITILRWWVLVISAIWGIITIYGLAGTLRPAEVEKLELKIPGLAAKDDGLRVVQISDLHISWWNSRAEMDRIGEKVKDLNPDLLLITGDIADHNPEYVNAFADGLEQVKPRLGRYAIIGNHDVYTDAEAVAERMEARGFRMLRRELVNLREQGADLALGGMDDSGLNWTGADPDEKDIAKIIARAPSDLVIIWLGHRPSCFEVIKGLPVALTLAGHTHGGQLKLPFGWPGLADLGFARTSGFYQENGQMLYVSRGMGTVGWPFRINCPAEITLIVLRSSESGAFLRKEK